MLHLPTAQTKIVVIDADRNAYQDLIERSGCDPVSFCFFDSAEAALHARLQTEVDLWLINVELPDMSGMDLLTMLKRQMGRAPVFLVADAYSPEHEIAALTTGCAHFTCKPLAAEWLVEMCRKAASVPAQAVREHARQSGWPAKTSPVQPTVPTYFARSQS